MAYANLNKDGLEISGFDHIVVTKDLGDIPCGVTLDVSAVTANVINAGHVLVQNTTTKAVKPLAFNDGGTAYASKDESDAYFGILKYSVLKSSPMAAVLRIGQVNAAAAEKSVGVAVPAGAISALTGIDFIY